MNGDNLEDMIVGNYDGYVYMYTRKADKTLNAAVKLNTKSGTPIKNNAKWEKGTYAAITDWNNDGLKDLVIAFHHYNDPQDTKKCVSLFLNVGTKTAPLFEDKGIIQAGGAEINKFWFQCPQVADLNMDGKKDFLLGHSGWEGETPNGTGYLWYYENSGTDAAPVLKAGVKLMLKNGMAIQDTGLKNLNNFCVCQWDNDGVWDLLVVHEDWKNPGEFRGEPQRPTIRILKGVVPTGFAEENNAMHKVSLPDLYITGNNAVVLKNSAGMSLSIYSITGKLMNSYKKGEYTGESLRSDMHRFSPGAYVYSFFCDNKRVSGGKLFKGE